SCFDLTLFVASSTPPHSHPPSLPDALPISIHIDTAIGQLPNQAGGFLPSVKLFDRPRLQFAKQPVAHPLILHGTGTSCNVTNMRSEEHTSELQSRFDLVCRLLLVEKMKCIV